MYKQVIVPLDGTPLSETALPIAADLARKGGGRILLTKVIHPTPHAVGSPDGGMIPVYELRVALEAAANHYLSVVAKRLSDQGLQVDYEVRVGRTAPEVIALAKEQMASTVVVMATHGRTGLARLVQGSVASDVAHGSPHPVLLVQEGQPLSYRIAA